MSVMVKGLQKDQDRHGNWRWYYVHRRKKSRLRGISHPPPLPITDEVLTAYYAAKEKLAGIKREHEDVGSLQWLIERWYSSGDFKALDEATQADYQSILRNVPETDRLEQIHDFRPTHIRGMCESLVGSRGNKRLKALKRVFSWGVEREHMASNPALGIARKKIKTLGHLAWEYEDVAKYFETHPPGTKAHLCLALLLYTAARISDVGQFGPLTIRGHRFIFVMQKNRNREPKVMNIPLLPPLRKALRQSEGILGDPTFLVTEYDKPFSKKGLGQKFKDWCEQAGVQNKTAHGVRKYVGINAALNHATAKQIQEVLGHSSIEEAETYIQQANRIVLADQGFAAAFPDG